MAKRRLITAMVTSTTTGAASAAMSEMAASCEAPAKISIDIATPAYGDSPDSTAAMPAIRPNGATPGKSGSETRTPSRNGLAGGGMAVGGPVRVDGGAGAHSTAIGAGRQDSA